MLSGKSDARGGKGQKVWRQLLPVPALALAISLLVMCGCSGGGATASGGGQPAPDHSAGGAASSPTPAPSPAAASPAGTAPSGPPTGQGPHGVYQISEIEAKGKVQMIGEANAMQITFMQDGSFTRITKRLGKQAFSEGGNFRVEGDHLIFDTTMANKEILKAATQKDQQFTLTPDGEELRMLGANGAWAVFRKVTVPGAK